MSKKKEEDKEEVVEETTAEEIVEVPPTDIEGIEEEVPKDPFAYWEDKKV